MALDVPVTYPSGATGSARVYLELVIDTAGRVSRVQLVSGAEPFAQAAREAARTWRFQPALRERKAISARIRFVVHYQETQDSAPPEIVSPDPTSVPQQSTTEVDVDLAEHLEVVVQAEYKRRDQAITRAEARELPGAFGDPLRAIEVLPGVTPVVSGLPLFFVRGAPPGNVGFFIDGIAVPLLYHAFLGPAVIHPAMIDRLDLHRGPYPAKFGRFAGAVAAIESAQPEGEVHGEASLRLFDGGAFVEAPFAGERGAAQIAGRYSFTGLLLSQFVEGTLEYWDYQALASYDLDRQNRVGAFLFGAFDLCKDLCSDDEDAEGTSLGSGEAGVEFHRADLRFDHSYGSGSLRVAATVGFDRTRGGLGFEARNDLLQGRVEHDHKLRNNLSLRTGIDLASRDYQVEIDRFSSDFDDVQELFFPRRDSVLGAYAELSYTPTRRVTVMPGLRADWYKSAQDVAVGVDPRLSTVFTLAPDWRLLHGVGLSHQPPNYVPNVPGLQVAGIPNGLQRAVHTATAVATDLGESVELTLGAFYNAYFGLTDPFGISQDFVLDSQAARETLIGSSKGLELHLRRPFTRRWSGLLSYTLSRTERSHEEISTLAGYDRPHVVNAASSYQFAEHWRIGARSVLYSGIPGRDVTGRRFNQSRGPAFFRLDAKLEYGRRWGRAGSWSVFLEILNATLAREVVRRTCGPNGCSDRTVGPLFLPSLGGELRY